MTHLVASGWSGVVLFALAGGCAGVEATVQVMNGPTPVDAAPTERGEAPDAAALVSDGIFALSPTRMTITLTALGFVPEGSDADRVKLVPLDDCTATYDRALSSLTPLGSCAATVPVGTYVGVVIGHRTTYEMVVDDPDAGIWSDPSAPGLLATTAPEGGAQPIPVRDTNADSDEGQASLFFSEPLGIDEAGAPEVFVVFDPTHWMKAAVQGGVFTEPFAAGNPPILPTVDGYAKATYYSNNPAWTSYRWDGCQVENCMSLLFLFQDAETPVSVTWQDRDLCRGGPGSQSPVVAFAGDSGRWGDFGRLGRDDAGVLAWASAEQGDGGGSEVTGFTGVYRMPEAATPGDVVALDYRCTADVPDLVAGDTYSSGAPVFTPDGTLSLTLRY